MRYHHRKGDDLKRRSGQLRSRLSHSFTHRGTTTTTTKTIHSHREVTVGLVIRCQQTFKLTVKISSAVEDRFLDWENSQNGNKFGAKSLRSTRSIYKYTKDLKVMYLFKLSNTISSSLSKKYIHTKTCVTYTTRQYSKAIKITS